MSDFSIYILVVLAIAISPFLVGIAFYGAVLYANKKYMKEIESRERQAKLEAHWDEEQMRLHGIPQLGRYPKWDGFKKHPIPPDKPFFIPHKNIAELNDFALPPIGTGKNNRY